MGQQPKSICINFTMGCARRLRLSGQLYTVRQQSGRVGPIFELLGDFMIKPSRTSALRRTGLFATTALFMMSGASAALAQDSGALDEAMNAERDTGDSIINRDRIGDELDAVRFGTLDAHTLTGGGHIAPGAGGEDPAITINNNFSPVNNPNIPNVYDPTNVTGIGQVISDAGGGFIGTCTGTLINARTIIFAAHCVNGRAATAYGANSGGVGIGVGFETNTRANAAGQTDELVRWLLGQGPNQDGRFQSNRAQQFYNISQVFYDSRSQAPASCTSPTSCFLEADVATAVLDTPTRGVPTWTMLFSPLLAPAAIDPVTGTGYHVSIAGYGAYGTGTTGAATSGNFRRRLAENILGGLTSIDERNIFLFGAAGAPARPQLLYWLDFDDPARGTATANPRDFNGFRDNALTREGLTGPGDSGGPLIIDQAFGQNVRTIIGVLSGGSTFFQGQPGGSYGTQAFYQPLFLYWDWIVANNPYRYATAVAGNRNWEDASAWVTTLDPAYQILNANGQLTNGLPTHLGGANQNTDGQFGELCFQSPSSSPNPATNECVDLATGTPRNNVPNTPAGDISSPDTVAIAANETDSAEGEGEGEAVTANNGRGGLDGPVDTAHAEPGYTDVAAPAPTIANGLPGATNFVPNNVDGDRVTGTLGRYYDITLRNAGTVTLSSAVTIDNFTMAGAQSQLTVATGGSLTSLIDVNHMTGIVNVNGTIRSMGDYFFMSGLLTGNGRVNANFLTSVIGNFAPGTMGTIGNLTIGGNLVMGSGSTYVLDVGPNNTSDRIVVVADGANTGTANVGGRVAVTPVAGSTIRFGNLYTILTAAGGVTGTFTSTDISAILRQTFIYGPNQVQLRITAVPYASVVTSTSPVQVSYATLLDANRSTASLIGIYDVLDLQNAATIQSTLEALAPRTETLRQSLGVVALDNSSRVVRERLHSLTPGNLGGQVAFLGRRVETAALNLAGLSNGTATMSDVSTQEAGTMTRLPERMSAFLAVGYIDGTGAPMVSARPNNGKDDYNGLYGTAGIEAEVGERSVLGASIGFTNLDGEVAARDASADANLYQATIYGKVMFDGHGYVDGQLTAGILETSHERAGNLPGQPYTLRGSDSALAFGGEIAVGALFGERIKFGPRAALRFSQINFGDLVETGGPTALAIDRDEYRSIQARAGMVFDGTGRIRPRASATFVHDFAERNTDFGANFVGGGGSNVLFDLAGQDRNWGEVSGGLAVDLGRLELSVSADTTIGRGDFNNQSYRLGARIRF